MTGDDRIGDLQSMSPTQVRAYFIASYEAVWGAHPASSALRKQDPDVARMVRAMWGELIDSVEPHLIPRLIEEVKGARADMDRRGKPALEDFRRAAKKLREYRGVPGADPAPRWIDPEDRPITRREYLLANQDRHRGSPTFAKLWQLEFGTKWPGYVPAKKKAAPVEAGVVTSEDVDAALELEERLAIQSESTN